MPRYDTGLYQDTMGRLSDYVKQKLPPDVVEQITSDVDRNIFGGKVTFPKIVRFGQSLIGKTPQEQLTNFVTPSGMYVKPKWGETGSFSALFDKKLRVEISDELMKLKQPLQKNKPTTMWDLIDHPELYKREPWIEDIRIIPKPMEAGTTAEYVKGGEIINNYQKTMPYIYINQNDPAVMKNPLKTIAHELQHGMQFQYDFSKGGSPDLNIFEMQNFPTLHKASEDYQTLLKNPKNKEALDTVNKLVDQWEGKLAGDRNSLFMRFARQSFPHDLLSSYYKMNEEIMKLPSPMQYYRRLAGEIEARDTAERLMLNEAQRKSTLPYQGQGIPLEKMIVRE